MNLDLVEEAFLTLMESNSGIGALDDETQRNLVKGYQHYLENKDNEGLGQICAMVLAEIDVLAQEIVDRALKRRQGGWLDEISEDLQGDVYLAGLQALVDWDEEKESAPMRWVRGEMNRVVRETDVSFGGMAKPDVWRKVLAAHSVVMAMLDVHGKEAHGMELKNLVWEQMIQEQRNKAGHKERLLSDEDHIKLVQERLSRKGAKRAIFKDDLFTILGSQEGVASLNLENDEGGTLMDQLMAPGVEPLNDLDVLDFVYQNFPRHKSAVDLRFGSAEALSYEKMAQALNETKADVKELVDEAKDLVATPQGLWVAMAGVEAQFTD